ncbi:MAG TPA: hypothetical protein VMM79_19130 [Longimicrobiales bacterium]|nr:hypothetical protein [Longimicrobiales bacterium]
MASIRLQAARGYDRDNLPLQGREDSSEMVQEEKSAPGVSLAGRLEPLIVGFAAFLLYAVTGAREMQWGDPAKLTQFVHDGVLLFSQEAHIGHILFSMPFSHIPLGSFVLRMHLSSALTLGAAMGVGQAVLIGLGLSRPATRIAIAAVAVAHTIWFTGTIFESYPLVLLSLAAAAWLFVVAGRCFMGGVLLGFGATVHPITLFGLPGIAYGLWKSEHGRRGVVHLVGGLVVGAVLPVLGVLLVLQDEATLGINWMSASRQYGGLAYPLRNIPMLLGYAVYNFASPALVLLLIGMRRLTPNALRTAVLFAAPHYLVAIFWLPQRSYLIPLPVYFAAAFVIALGAEAVLRSWRRPRWILSFPIVALPILAYWMAPPIFTRLGFERTLRNAPYRNEATYFVQPWKIGERSARDYLDDLAEVLPPEPVVVGDWLLHTTVHAGQRVEGWREDATLFNANAEPCEEVAEAYRAGRRIFILDDTPGYMPQCFLRLGPRRPVPGVERLTEVLRDETG